MKAPPALALAALAALLCCMFGCDAAKKEAGRTVRRAVRETLKGGSERRAEGGIEVKVIGPGGGSGSVIPAATPVATDVFVRNRSGQAITGIQVEVKFSWTLPLIAKRNLWTVDRLSPGESKRIHVPFGAPRGSHTITAIARWNGRSARDSCSIQVR